MRSLVFRLFFVLCIAQVMQAQVLKMNRDRSVDPFVSPLDVPFTATFPSDASKPANRSIVRVSLPGEGFSPESLKKAEYGDPVAQTVIGWAYAKGDGVKQDGSKAVSWLQRAAVDGSVTAKVCLGVLYI